MFSSYSQVQEVLSSAEAFAAIILAATVSDGELSDLYRESISFNLSRMKLFQTYSSDGIRAMLNQLSEILRREGMNDLFNAANKSLSPDLREVAFAIVSDLVLVDGIITPDEQGFLRDLYQALNVPTETATKIVEVMLIKNRA